MFDATTMTSAALTSMAMAPMVGSTTVVAAAAPTASTEHAAEGGYGHGRSVSHPPEPPHFIQMWFYGEYDGLKEQGKNPYGDPVDDGTFSQGLTVPQILHVGRLKEPIPLVGYAPWENHVYFGIGCFILIALAFMLTSGIRRPLKEAMRKPTRGQVVVETLVDSFDNFIGGILGEKNGRLYLPFIGTLFLLILTLNLMGIVPTMRAPTASILITVSLALSTLVVVQFTAWARLGPLTYLHHLAGSPQTPVQWILSPLFLVLEALSDFVIKPLSLSLRLMGNIFGKDILLGSFLFMGIALLGLIAPGAERFGGIPLSLPFYFLAMLLSAIQALIFALLSTIYILLVLPHDHDHHGEEHAHH